MAVLKTMKNVRRSFVRSWCQEPFVSHPITMKSLSDKIDTCHRSRRYGPRANDCALEPFTCYKASYYRVKKNSLAKQKQKTVPETFRKRFENVSLLYYALGVRNELEGITHLVFDVRLVRAVALAKAERFRYRRALWHKFHDIRVKTQKQRPVSDAPHKLAILTVCKLRRILVYVSEYISILVRWALHENNATINMGEGCNYIYTTVFTTSSPEENLELRRHLTHV